jgi:hypothetical protein
MDHLKRVGLAVSIVSVISFSLAAAVVASGGGLPPGDYAFTNTGGQAFFTSPGGGKGAPGFDVLVNRGVNSLQAEDGAGSPTVTKSTMLQLSVFSPTGGGGGCFIIKPADFTVGRNLQTAALHTTVMAADLCPGIGAPVKGAGISAPLPGGGGGGLVFPVKVDVTWSGLGLTGVGHDTNTFVCGDYSTRSKTTARSAGSTASGTVSSLDGTFTSNFAGLNTSDTQLQVNGALKPACLTFGP